MRGIIRQRIEEKYRTNNAQQAVISRNCFLVITFPSFSEVCCGLLRFPMEIELHWVITRYTVSRTYPTASHLLHTWFDFTLEHSA